MYYNDIIAENPDFVNEANAAFDAAVDNRVDLDIGQYDVWDWTADDARDAALRARRGQTGQTPAARPTFKFQDNYPSSVPHDDYAPSGYTLVRGQTPAADRNAPSVSVSVTPDGDAEWAKFERLYERLHGDKCGYLWMMDEIKTYHPSREGLGRRTYTRWLSPTDPLWVGSNELRDMNVYFGVHPTREVGTRSLRSTVSPTAKGPNVCEIRCLYAEFDAKDFDPDLKAASLEYKEYLNTGGDPADYRGRQADPAAGKAAILAHIEGLEFQPSVIVDSGGGYHCYWFLSAPFVIEGKNSMTRARRIQAAWVAFVGGDTDAKDLVRILRPAGTFNQKRCYTDSPRMCFFVQEDWGVEYSFEELEAACQSIGQREAKHEITGRPSATRVSQAPQMPVAARIEATGAVLGAERFRGLEDATGVVDLLADLPIEIVDDFGQWMRLGWGLHHESGGADWGLALWDRASQASQKWTEGECAKLWVDFRADGGATMASFYKLRVPVMPRIRMDDEFGLLDYIPSQLAATLIASADQIPEIQTFRQFSVLEHMGVNRERKGMAFTDGGFVQPFDWMLDQLNSPRVLVECPTGRGKTWAFVNGEFDGILAVPTRAIGQQMAAEFGVPFVDGETEDCRIRHNGHIKIIVTYDSLGKVISWLAADQITPADLILGIDEIHMFDVAHVYRHAAIDKLTALAPLFKREILLTATPKPLSLASFTKTAALVRYSLPQKESVRVEMVPSGVDAAEIVKAALEEVHRVLVVVDNKAACDEIAKMFGGIAFHSENRDPRITGDRIPDDVRVVAATSVIDVGISITPHEGGHSVIFLSQTHLTPERVGQASSRMRKGQDFQAPHTIYVQMPKAEELEDYPQLTLDEIDRRLEAFRQGEAERARQMLIYLGIQRIALRDMGHEYSQIDAWLDTMARDNHIIKGEGEGHHAPYEISVNSIDAAVGKKRRSLMSRKNIVDHFAAHSSRFEVASVTPYTASVVAKATVREAIKLTKAEKKAKREAAYAEADALMKANGPEWISRVLTTKIDRQIEVAPDVYDRVMKVREIQKVGALTADSIYTLESVLALIDETKPETKTAMTQLAKRVKRAEMDHALESSGRQEAREILAIKREIEIGKTYKDADLKEMMRRVADGKIALTFKNLKSFRKLIKETFGCKERKLGPKESRIKVLEIESAKPYDTKLIPIKPTS